MSLHIDTIQELLTDAFVNVFKTMVSLETGPTQEEQPRGTSLVSGSVGITGDVSGIAYLYVEESFAKRLTCQMLGLTESEIEGDEMVNDVIGEISNMVVGGTKTRICDKGFAVSLTIPTILRGRNFRAHSGSSSVCRRFSMKCGVDVIRIELLMKKS